MSSVVGSSDRVRRRDALAAGQEAIARGAWAEARREFEAAVSAEATPEALEGLGLAAWWLDDAAATFEARERAYRLYLAADERCAAARLALWLAWDYEAFRGEAAVANGWLRRARRHLEGLEPTDELALLVIREGELALRSDTAEAQRLAREGATLARVVGSVDLEMMALALEGMALVTEGQIEEGMLLLDEAAAAAIGGELSDLTCVGRTCCRLIAACERVGDYDRALQWCGRMVEFARRWQMESLFAICRAQYASVLVGCGNWPEAERTLLEATTVLAERRPPMVAASLARLAELRRRQGRREEAARLFAQADGLPLALLGRAELALDAGDCDAAAEFARGYLRSLAPEDRLARAQGLELIVRIDPASEAAHAAVSELHALATQVPTAPVRAAAMFAEALTAGDPARMEEAVDLFERAGEPYEAARARAELARLTGEPRHEEAAQAAIARLTGGRGRPTVLTPRELEVLRLIADGLSDAEIAARLVLSEHTVHRHVANIRTKLRQPSRAAAAAHAARAGLL